MNVQPAFVPAPIDGKNIDLEYAIEYASVEESVAGFQAACTRLLLPSVWHDLGGMASAKFSIATPGNTDVSKILEVNDFVCINIPGPGNQLGNGFDWTKVTQLCAGVVPEADESFGLILAACSNPENAVNDAAHFFEESSTSTFIIKRVDKIVTATYHGRNEKPNTHTESVVDNIRNAVIAAGAGAGLSELQWKALIKGLIT